MANALARVEYNPTRRYTTRRYKITLSGNYTNGGEVLDFTAATVTGGKGDNKAIGYGLSITDSRVTLSLPNPGFAGYVFALTKGTTFANSKLNIYQSDDAVDPLDELTGGAAIPAALTASVDIYVDLTTPNPY